MFSGADFDRFESSIGPQIPTLDVLTVDGLTLDGRLCASIEGGGKRRIFAIGNYVNQRQIDARPEGREIAARQLHYGGL